jgi:biotin operon repressor
MLYRRSQEIEDRLVEVLRLIRTGRYSTPILAAKIGVSIPTISRCVESLRDRGYGIRSLRGQRAWRYILESEPAGSRRRRTSDRRLASVSQ